jgi:hypothetical protein
MQSLRKNRLFDIRPVQGGVPDAPCAKSKNFHSKYLLAHFAKVKELQRDLGRLPEREEFFFLQTDGQWNAFTFLPFVLGSFQVKNLHCCTYSISRRTIDALMELHDAGKVDRIELLISDSMIKRNPVTIDVLTAMAKERPNIVLKYAWVHAKVTLMECLGGHYVVEGSGNWSENAHYEQYLFANSKGLYDFRMELFENAKLR